MWPNLHSHFTGDERQLSVGWRGGSGPTQTSHGPAMPLLGCIPGYIINITDKLLILLIACSSHLLSTYHMSRAVQNTLYACSSLVLTAAQAVALLPICRRGTRLGEVEWIADMKLLCETRIRLTLKTVLSWATLSGTVFHKCPEPQFSQL